MSTAALSLQGDPLAAPGRLRLDPRSRGWTLLAAAACLLPLLLQLPAALSAGIALAGVAVTALSWRRPLPAWMRVVLALVLLAAVLAAMRFAIGRDTGCALLAAMLAIKPSETLALRDARSLVGFALFAPFATFLLDQGPASLAMGLVAITLSLAALQRLAELESGDSRRAPPPWRRFAAVWRMILLGLPIALAVFWLFPRLAAPLWGVPERALARPGLSGEMTPSEWIDLLADDTPALRASFLGEEPEPQQMYWRGPVLWDFDGATWREAPWLRAMPDARIEPGATTWEYELELEPTEREHLVALELVREAPEGARLSRDHVLEVPRPLTGLTRWRMRSSPPRAFEPQLPAMLRQAALRLPQGFNPRTIALARRWRAEAGDDDAAIVQRALDLINQDFAYSLGAPPAGRHAVDEFLFETRLGFCQHYSSSFAVLMRAAGVPTRVVTGYAGGYRNPIGGYWLLRRSDAHAWNEVWLEGSGWVRVDPTAAVAPERIYDTIADRRPGAEGLLGAIGAGQAFDVADWMRRGWNDFVLGFDAARQRRMLQPLGLDATPARLATLFAGVAVVALLLTWWLVARDERERDPVLRAWHRMGRRYARLGLARQPHEPPLAWARRVASSRPAGVSELNALSLRFAEWRYAPHDGDARAARSLVRDLRAHRP